MRTPLTGGADEPTERAAWSKEVWRLLVANVGEEQAADDLVQRCIAKGVDFIRRTPQESVDILMAELREKTL